MNTCPICRKPVDPRLTRCPWDGSLLGTIAVDPLLGTTIGGRYLLKKRIGERGQAFLYAAEEEATQKRMIATVLLVGAIDEPSFNQFRSLAEALSTPEHPTCSSIKDYGRLPDQGVFIVEEGELWHQLRQELVLKGRLPATRVLALAIQLMEGIDYIHGKGLYHGRLCPSSLRLTFNAQGNLVLLIPSSEIPARLLDQGSDEEGLSYQLADAPPGPETDLYAASLLLAEMLLGERPDLSRPEAPDWSKVNLATEITSGLKAIIERGLGLNGERFGSAWEMRDDLSRLTGQRSQFGRYDLLHRLAHGGMGDIYLARAMGIEGIDINRLCVIKTVRTNLIRRREYVDRFIAEARVLASLSHGNIVPVYDVGKVGSIFYIAMEYVKGKDLRKILNRAGKDKLRMTVPLALFVAKELANGLAYAHRAKVQGIGGLVHRDVSPHNILVSYDGEVKLIDFGLAQLAGTLPAAEDGVVMGKVCYLSPEQARAEPLDQRTDIFSAGLVLFELLTGVPFFNQSTIGEVLTHVANPKSEPPSARAADIPPEVDRICLRAMAPIREDRYHSAGALRDDLTAALARIAPRTNPEEVGAFVRDLFTSEQKDEQTLLSDLSLTMPPVSRALQLESEEDAEKHSDWKEMSNSEAISLLENDPHPVQLASTLRTRAKPSAEALKVATGIHPDQAGERPRRNGWGEPTLRTEAIDDHSPRRRYLPIAIGMLVALVGGSAVFLFFNRLHDRSAAQDKEERAKAQAAFKKLASWTMNQNQPVQPEQKSTPPHQALKVGPTRRYKISRQAGPDAQPRTSRRKKHRAHQCYLEMVGGDGLKMVVDHGAQVYTLPLKKRLPLTAGQAHHILVERKGYQSFEKNLPCLAGEEYRIKLRIK